MHSEDVSDSSTEDDDEYMVPVGQRSHWPDGVPPGLSSPKNSTAPSNVDNSKSSTLLSVGSNVYEDVDSSSDDERSTATGERSDDVYSDFLDETFAIEDDPKGLISSTEHD